MWFLYELLLEGEHYYIGITRRPRKRLRQHREKKGAAFTQRHAVVKTIRVSRLGTDNKRLAEGLENKKTLQYIETHGPERVRGGYYAQTGTWDERTINRMKRPQRGTLAVAKPQREKGEERPQARLSPSKAVRRTRNTVERPRRVGSIQL